MTSEIYKFKAKIRKAINKDGGDMVYVTVAAIE
ncbi:MAG: DUF1905 domain-containing protein [Bacteroidales bacterium]|jgi:hypothetical protein|nr:DUF1905 domain-containing protein [Bacteroidales bacterium]